MSDDDLWIVVPNWERHQHYSDRTPPWIKLYIELLHNHGWMQLSYAERGVLVTLWMEFAASCGQLSVDMMTRSSRHRLNMRTLESLNHAGFIELSASKPSRVRAGAPSQEKRREEKNALAPAHAKSERERAKENPDGPRANADAYKPYNPDEPDADPEALARLLELQARIGRDLSR